MPEILLKLHSAQRWSLEIQLLSQMPVEDSNKFTHACSI